MTSIEALDIIFLPRNGVSIYFALFKIGLIGISLEVTQMLLYPSVVGIDPWVHQMFTLNMLSLGRIPEGYGYSSLPFMHLLVGSTSIITGLDYRLSTILSISIPQVFCNILLTYLLGNFLLNKKIGLFGGLLLAVANWHVTMGFWAIPNTIAAVYIPIITYLLLKVRVERLRMGTLLMAFFMGSLILTHTVSAACLAILLFAFWAGFKVHSFLYRERKASLPIGIPILFTVGMFSWWTFASGSIMVLGELIKLGFSLDYILSKRALAMPEYVVQYMSKVPFSEQLFNNLGMFLFFSLSIIGMLYMVRKRFGSSYTFVVALGGVMVLSLSSFAVITRLGIIVERWWYFSEILLALPLSVTLFLFWGILKNKVGRTLLLASLTFSLSFPMIMSPTANLDNSTFSPNSQVRFALIQSELQAIKKVSNMWNRTIGVDGYYSELRTSLYSVKEINREIAYKNYTNCQGMLILIREDIVKHPLLLSYVYKLDYDPRDVLTSQTFSKVYDCGSVCGFVDTKYFNFTQP
jgi:hypothetical protein